jgi:hypothetical protein
MKKIFLNIFAFILLFAIQITAQQFLPDSPEWLVDKFFSKTNFPEKAEYYTGEMLNETDQPTIGEELNGKGEIYFHQIKAVNDEIVFAVEVKLENKIIDFYSYLKKENDKWKIFATRRFILPDFVFQVLDSLSKQPSLADSSFYLSLQLFTMNDAQLKNYFMSNLDSFNELISYFDQGNKEGGDKLLAYLGLNAIFFDNNFPGCVFVMINTIQRLANGFIFATENAKLPVISVNEFIYVEEVVPGWFIFRSM